MASRVATHDVATKSFKLQQHDSSKRISPADKHQGVRLRIEKRDLSNLQILEPRVTRAKALATGSAIESPRSDSFVRKPYRECTRSCEACGQHYRLAPMQSPASHK